MLSRMIKEELILLDLKSRTKEEIIEEMGHLFVHSGSISDLDEFIRTIQEREAIESTAIGGGVAIPHGRSGAVEELCIAFGGSKTGVDFGSLDGEPVHLIFMIASPLSAPGEYLQAVAKIARFLKMEDLKHKLLGAKTKGDVLEVLREFDARVPRKIEVKPKEGRTIYKSKQGD
ncbi:PTS sugar transporter subunit IIA [candidate division KSB1 bacterium]|nr:PTS sugar transporter subunit IIA [candidate division KSB1 bacterium]